MSATNQVASSVTSIADKVGKIGSATASGRPSWTMAPTTRPRNRYAGKDAQVGLIIMPKPTVVTAYPTVVATGRIAVGMVRASAIAAIGVGRGDRPRLGQAGDVVDAARRVELQRRMRGPVDF